MTSRLYGINEGHFDQVLKGLATNGDLAGLVTSQDAAATEKRILKRIDESQDELTRIIADTIAPPFTKRFETFGRRG